MEHTARRRSLAPAAQARHQARAGGGIGLQRSMLHLQAAAGNRAVAGLVARSRATTPRAPADPGREVPAEGLPVQRHSSWEHKLLGDANPQTLAKMGSWQDLITQTTTGGQQSGTVQIGGVAGAVDKGQVMHVLVQEMARLKSWQDSPPTAPSTADAMHATRKDDTFDVIVVRLPGPDGLMITYGEMNTLADFYGDLDTMKTANPKHRRQIVQSVRKETFLRLKEIYDSLSKSLTAQEKTSQDVVGAKALYSASNLGKAKFAGAATPDFISGVAGQADLLAGDSPVIGQGTGARGDTNKYGATLARNACHFVPESWHAWAKQHGDARALALESWNRYLEAKRLQDAMAVTDFAKRPLDQVEAQSKLAVAKAVSSRTANEALVANGFGDHYLQDSYASGHMINKTQIMQWYVQFIDKNDKWDYFKDKNWRKVQQMAYRQDLAQPGQYDKANVRGATAGNQNEAAARDPQSVESGVAGDWKARFDALGLQVPASLRTPGTDTRRVVEWWQGNAMRSIFGRSLTGADFGSAPVQGAALQTALIQLIRDGVVRTTEAVTARGGYMAFTDQQIARAHFTNFAKTKLVLREDYIPSGSGKRAKFRSALAQSSRGDDAAYQKMAASVTYGDYLEFIKSGFLQKSTNALHDTFCQRGLKVTNQAGGVAFKVYGDDRMFNEGSSAGVTHSAETANMSRDSILSIINSGADGGTSTASILARLPSHVELDVAGNPVTEDIATWHNSSQPGRLHDLCDSVVFPQMSWSLMQKAVPGIAGSDLGKISRDEGVHGADAF